MISFADVAVGAVMISFLTYVGLRKNAPHIIVVGWLVVLFFVMLAGSLGWI